MKCPFVFGDMLRYKGTVGSAAVSPRLVMFIGVTTDEDDYDLSMRGIPMDDGDRDEMFVEYWGTAGVVEPAGNTWWEKEA